jgi:transglycosylase-like protein
VRLDARKTFFGLLIAGIAGGFLLLPAIVYVGTFLSPTQITPATRHVPPLIGEALWARAGGGQDSQLRQLNPFTIARMASCHLWAETIDDRAESETQHEECMKLMPGVQAVGYISTLHLQSEGVWQDPRVPFVQLATMTRVTDRWTRAELIDTLAERAEYGDGIRGVERAAQSYFGRAASEVTVAQAALLAAAAGDRRLDPWCNPEAAAAARRRILTRMRDNAAIDDATLAAADRSGLGLIDTPPEGHKRCGG